MVIIKSKFVGHQGNAILTHPYVKNFENPSESGGTFCILGAVNAAVETNSKSVAIELRMRKTIGGYKVMKHRSEIARHPMPPKKNPDSRPRDKVLDLYQRLVHDGRAHYQADIARDLECSPQTVSRLIDVIEGHLGKDIFLERGLNGRRRFYRIVTKSQSRGLGFSFEELHFLAVCRDLAAPHLPDSVLDRIEHTLTALALTLGERSRPVGPPVGFRGKGYIDYGPHMDTIAKLRTAIEKRQVCQVSYTAGGRAEPKSYRYAPGRILVMGGTIYVLGYRMEADSLIGLHPFRKATWGTAVCFFETCYLSGGCVTRRRLKLFQVLMRAL